MSSSLLVADVIRSHIEKIRNYKPSIFLNSKFIVIPESNLPGLAVDVRQQVKRLQIKNLMFMNEDGISSKNSKSLTEGPGVKTTRYNKPIMVELLIKVLRSRNIIFFHTFIISQPGLAFIQNLKEEYMKQMRAFSRIQKLSNDAEIGTQIIYNGKTHGNNDDCVMVTMLNLKMAQKFFEDAKYKNERMDV